MLVGDYGAELVQCARRVANCALVGVCVGEYCSGNGTAEDVAQCYLLLLFLKVSELHSARRKCGFQGRGVFSEASGPSSFEFGLAEFTSGTAASLLLSFRDIPLSVPLWLSAIQ